MFLNNHVAAGNGSGGGVFCALDSIIKLNGSTIFSNNTAVLGGGMAIINNSVHVCRFW